MSARKNIAASGGGGGVEALLARLLLGEADGGDLGV
jgi:hypothetical protein